MAGGAVANHTTAPPPASGTAGTSAHAPAAPDHVPGRPPWSPPGGRELLAGVAVVAVLFAVLVVYTHDVPPRPRSGSAGPFSLRSAAALPPRASAPASWDDVPVAGTLAELGPVVARAVAGKLASARPRIAACAAATADVPRDAGRTPSEVVLRLAPRSGAVHVEGIEPRSPGAPPAVLHCARRMLDGEAIPASPVVPGRRYRVVVALE